VRLVKSWLALLSFGMLLGCAGKPFEAKPASASELTIALEVYYSGLLDRPFVSTSAPVDASGAFRRLNRLWCNPVGGPTLQMSRGQYAALCSRLGGAWRDGACIKPPDRDQVLFLAMIEVAPPACANGTTVRVVEPTGDLAAPAYVAQLRALGYQTNADLAAERARAEARGRERERQVRAEAERKEAMLPRMRMRGTRVCHAESGNTWVGFVEDSTEEKLQIRVVTAFRTGVPQMTLGGFQPHITWDIPARWELCE
jgi:hypothetical protein